MKTGGGGGGGGYWGTVVLLKQKKVFGYVQFFLSDMHIFTH